MNFNDPSTVIPLIKVTSMDALLEYSFHNRSAVIDYIQKYSSPDEAADFLAKALQIFGIKLLIAKLQADDEAGKRFTVLSSEEMRTAMIDFLDEHIAKGG